MNFKFFIAKRFLFSKKGSKFISFITFVSVIGLALGVAALIITTSILSGMKTEIKEKVAGLISHIQIYSFKNEGITNYQEVINDVKTHISEIKGISPVVQREAVIRYKENVEGIMLKGIIPETDISTARNKIVNGEFNLKPVDTIFSRIIIGDKLAKKMKIDVGNKIIVFGIKGIPSPLNQPKIKQFIVSGIYETGLRDFDDVIVYTDLRTSQNMFDMGNNITMLELSIEDIEKSDEISDKIKEILVYPNFPRSLFKTFRGLFTWVELQSAPTPIILGLIIIVASFNIIGALLMLVLEKTQSIGILKSLGTSNKDIMKIFIFDGMIIGFIGIILGNIIGIGLALLELKFKLFTLPELYYMKSVPIELQTGYIILISAITFCLVIAATLIPSYLASKFDPIKSTRFV